MGDDEAGRSGFAGREAQAARRCQLDLVQDADDDGEALGEALSLEAFFEGVQGVSGTGRLDDDEARRIEP